MKPCKRNSLFYTLYGSLISFVLVFFDQVTKILAADHLKGKQDIKIIDGILELHYLYPENRGIAFGMFQGSVVFFAVMTVILFAFLLYCYIKIPKNKYYLPLIGVFFTLIAGAIGNFIDRIFRGYVIDFIYFKIINFPIFNLADIYVTVSEAVLIFLICFKYKEKDFTFLSKKQG